MAKKVTVAIAGLGSRGKDSYAPIANEIPEKMEIVAIADIDEKKVEEVAKIYGIPRERCFLSADEMIQHEKLADVMFIATQDRDHASHAIPAIKKGYHLLLEKPISPDLQECNDIHDAARENNVKVVICHVLRYAPFYTELKRVLDSGVIGDIVTVMALENVGYWHQAHSFVRGNWRDSNTTSPMILAKSCHDMDILLWLTGKKCESVTSYGNTFLFKEECAPEGATKRCMDGCKAKEGCAFDAEKIYLDHPRLGARHGNKKHPLSVLALKPTEETISEAIKTGPYGRCVYYCDNNVVDHQVVNMNMTDGSTISFTMSGFTASAGGRYTKLMGTKGEITADMESNTIRVYEFLNEKTTLIDVTKKVSDLSGHGHGGGDRVLVEDFIDMIKDGTEPTFRTSSLEQSLESHYVALASEESRLNKGTPVYIDTYRSK